MNPLAGQSVFGVDLHADFHGAFPRIVHPGLQDDQEAESNRNMEIEPLHRGGDDRLAAVPVGDDGANHVDPVH